MGLPLSEEDAPGPYVSIMHILFADALLFARRSKSL